MGKKTLAALLAAVLLCGLLMACGGRAEPERDAEYDTYMELMLTDWMRYLSASEALYADLDWAFSYTAALDGQPNWDTLLCARAAVELAAKRIELREAPAWDAPAEAYDYFMDREVDVSFVQPELENFESNRQTLLNSCNTLRQNLTFDVFFLDGLSRTVDAAAVKARMIETTLDYLAYSTEYLLMELNDGEWMDKVHESMKEACPRINAIRDASMAKEDVQEAASNAVEAYSDAVTEYVSIIGRNQAESDLISEYIDQGDFAAVTAMFSAIDGLPALLPEPGWELTEATYYWTNEDGTRRYLTKKEDLTGPPENFVLEFSDVTEEEVVEYISQLYHEIGLDGEWKDCENGNYDVYFQTGDSVFAVSWTEKGAAVYMLKNPVCLVPDWFISADAS